MDDSQIVDLFLERSETAISAVAAKYEKYCYSISYHILSNEEDARECVNDTYLDAWNAIPPHRPGNLSTFLGKITRRISIDKWRRQKAGKRGSGEVTLVLEELEECIPAGNTVEEEIELKELAQCVNDFIMSLPLQERRVFICRYWYLKPISDICQQFGFSKSKVKMMLLRMRKKLLVYLEKEGFKYE